MKKSVILSSAGLKNVLKEEEKFTFIFNSKEIEMDRISAEFISPIVSSLHYSDPTISSITFKTNPEFDNFAFESIIDQDITAQLIMISSGSAIKINEEQCFKMQQIAILLGNDELFHKLGELYPIELNETNIDRYLQIIQLFEYISSTTSTNKIDFSSIFDFISSNFYKIDSEKLLKLPKSVFYSIISNSNLKLECEDSLFDIILNYFSNNDEKSGFLDFLEKIEIKNLSDEKFYQMMVSIDPNEVTRGLWQLICSRFDGLDSNENIVKKRYITEFSLKKNQQYLYSGRESDAFHGIIYNMAKEVGGNVHDKGAVEITQSSFRSSGEEGKVAADLENIDSFFFSKDAENSWIQYNFKEKKIRPTHYSIRTTPYDKGHSHFLSWVIEGSNTGSDDWKTLDRRNNVTELDGKSIVRTFEVQGNLQNNEYYQYIRLKQVGMNSIGYYHLGISALEYFGQLA